MPMGSPSESHCRHYKLLSLTYKVLTTAQPSYLHNLITLQPPRSITRFSVVVTISRPPTISSLKIIDRSSRYVSPRLWNQLTDSLRQPHQSCLDSLPHPLVYPSLSSSPLSSSITPSLFTPGLKPTFSTNPFHLRLLYMSDCLTLTGPGRTYHAHHFIFNFTF